MKPAQTTAYASFDLMGFEFFVTAEVEITYFGCAAKISGPPEDCYPTEAPEYTVTSIVIEMDEYKQQGPKCDVDPKTAQFYVIAEAIDDAIYPQVCEAISEIKAERLDARNCGRYADV